jgi:hypothetical protein
VALIVPKSVAGNDPAFDDQRGTAGNFGKRKFVKLCAERLNEKNKSQEGKAGVRNTKHAGGFYIKKNTAKIFFTSQPFC